jgi:hypothetical protein
MGTVVAQVGGVATLYQGCGKIMGPNYKGAHKPIEKIIIFTLTEQHLLSG